MSILAQATTQPTTKELFGPLLFLTLLALPGIAFIIAKRLYHPVAVAGPVRLLRSLPLWPVVAAFFVMVSVYFGSQVVYVAWLQLRPTPTTQPVTQAAEMLLGNTHLVLLGTICPLLGLAAAILFLATLAPTMIDRLGMRFRPPMRILKNALLAAVFAVPATLLLGTIVELIYHFVAYEHEAEHQLLKVMVESQTWVRVLAMVSAIIVAPVAEEVLFRGLLQTSILTWLLRLRQPVAAVLASPIDFDQPPALPRNSAVPPPTVLPPNDPVSSEAIAYASGAFAPLPVDVPDDRPRHVQTWIAIVVTSFLFAAVHPLWTAPIIFCLSAMLGFVYERSGSLWVSILVHSAFNTTSTVLYLYMQTA